MEADKQWCWIYFSIIICLGMTLDLFRNYFYVIKESGIGLLDHILVMQKKMEFVGQNVVSLLQMPWNQFFSSN